MVPVVHTIELNNEYFVTAVATLHKRTNVTCHKGNSPEVLGRILPSIQQPILAFLDAHWNDYFPLRDEILTFAKYSIHPVFVIHDCLVPGRLDLGYDTYHGNPISYNYIQQLLENVYGKTDKYHVCYNDHATGAKRGIMYIEPVKINI
jgi:hypothetical protein